MDIKLKIKKNNCLSADLTKRENYIKSHIN